MLLYLDTSALVKFYVMEEGHDLVVTAIRGEASVAISVVGYPEARSALARKRREGGLNDQEYDRIITGLNEDWPTFVHIDVLTDLYFHAGRLAETHALRGFDAIHLASALHAEQSIDDSTAFLAFDERLNNAARSESLTIFEDEARA